VQAPLGAADDAVASDGRATLSFNQARSAAIALVEVKRAEAVIAASGEVPAVRSAVDRYMAARDARHAAQGKRGKSDARLRLTRHVLGDAVLSAVQLHALTTEDLRAWIGRLPKSLKGSSVRRLCNDFKAALNAAANADRERMPADLPARIKAGLAAGEDSQAAARDKQALPDDDIRRIIEAARAIDAEQDWEGDLYRMVLVLTATGARFSQVMRLTVSDVQRQHSRLMVPTSRKGRGVKKVTHLPVRVGADVIGELLSEIIGRRPDETLLLRWRHRQEKNEANPGRSKWVRDTRGPWTNAAELTRPWLAILARAELPAAIVPYALRHSSIVRQLRKGLPVQLVAKAHDTSAAIIERHYASAIVDALDALAAEAVIPLVPTTQGNVVALHRG
jgi:integrase